MSQEYIKLVNKSRTKLEQKQHKAQQLGLGEQDINSAGVIPDSPSLMCPAIPTLHFLLKSHHLLKKSK